MASKFRKNDTIKVICGKNKGKISNILKIFPRSSKVLVSGVNVVKKHIKPNKADPEGGIIKKEMPIHISNIMHVDHKTGVTSRVGFNLLQNGTKIRYLKKTQGTIEARKD
jgi:large subunit ribosomal protein L24